MQFSAQVPGFRVSLDTGDGGTPRGFDRRRRNRHGRGLRGALLPQGLPGSRTRSETFDDLVVDSAERLSELWGPSLEHVEYLVEEVPDNLESLIASGVRAPLGKYQRAMQPDGKSTITIFRHPVEALTDAPWQVRELVHEVVIEQVAGLLNIDPDTVDPLFRRFHGRN
jgi:hypothetical protein